MTPMKPGHRRFTLGLLAVGAWLALLLAARAVDDHVIAWLRHAGDDGVARRRTIASWLAAIDAAALYLCIPAILMAFGNWKRLLVAWTLPMMLMLGLTHLLKFAVGRARPLLDAGAHAFEPLSGREDMNSFPSGHTATAVTVALLLGIFFPRARIVFYLFAACVALERVVSDAHFPSDLVGGAAVGALSVWLSWKWLGPRFYQLQ